MNFYNCASYTLTLQRETKKCCSHSITTKALRELILDTIRTVSAYAIANEEAFRDRVLEASRIKQEAEAKGLKKKLTKAKKRYAELEVLIKNLYESYAMEKISEHRFDMLSAEYEQEQVELESVIAADQVGWKPTVSRIQTAYDMQYSPFTMAEARRYISNMLDEHEEEPRSVRERLRKHQQEQTALRKKEKDRDR